MQMDRHATFCQCLGKEFWDPQKYLADTKCCLFLPSFLYSNTADNFLKFSKNLVLIMFLLGSCYIFFWQPTDRQELNKWRQLITMSKFLCSALYSCPQLTSDEVQEKFWTFLLPHWSSMALASKYTDRFILAVEDIAINKCTMQLFQTCIHLIRPATLYFIEKKFWMSKMTIFPISFLQILRNWQKKKKVIRLNKIIECQGEDICSVSILQYLFLICMKSLNRKK